MTISKLGSMKGKKCGWTAHEIHTLTIHRDERGSLTSLTSLATMAKG